MALWELEELQGPEFLGFIRSVPPPEEFLGVSLLPTKTTTSLEYEYVLDPAANGRRPVMAHIMGWDSEAPIAGKRAPGAGQTIRGELPPIKRKYRFTEKELIKFKQPRPGTTDRQDVIDYVYDQTTDLIDSIQSRLEWLRMQALSEDLVAVDAEGVIVNVDFGIPTTQQYSVGVQSELSTWWNDTANSNPITDLLYICNQYEVNHGFRPSRALCDPTTRLLLLANNNIKTLIRGAGAPDVPLTVDELQALLDLYQLPTLIPYNVTILEENHDGTVTEVRPFNRQKMVLLPPESINLGNVLLGPTAEANKIPGVAYTQFAPGITGLVYGKDEPPGEWVKVAAVGFPTLPGAPYVVQIRIRNDDPPQPSQAVLEGLV